MKVGIVSDIHGNAAALRQALVAMGPVDELICLGDCINEYRFSNEVVALLKAANAHTIQGNHESVFFGPQGARARSASWIDAQLMDWLESRPSRQVLWLAGRQLLLVHSTPWLPDGQYVCAHDRAFQRFGETGADFLLYGHTHQPVVQRVGKTLVVNPGSAGDPRPAGRQCESSCAVLHVTTGEATIVRYPVQAFPAI
jgi:putative phosphoesterase